MSKGKKKNRKSKSKTPGGGGPAPIQASGGDGEEAAAAAGKVDVEQLARDVEKAEHEAEPSVEPQSVAHACAELLALTSSDWESSRDALMGYLGGGVTALSVRRRLPSDLEAWQLTHGHVATIPGLGAAGANPPEPGEVSPVGEVLESTKAAADFLRELGWEEEEDGCVLSFGDMGDFPAARMLLDAASAASQRGVKTLEYVGKLRILRAEIVETTKYVANEGDVSAATHLARLGDSEWLAASKALRAPLSVTQASPEAEVCLPVQTVKELAIYPGAVAFLQEAGFVGDAEGGLKLAGGAATAEQAPARKKALMALVVLGLLHAHIRQVEHDRRSAFAAVNEMAIPVPGGYEGPDLPTEGMTKEFVKAALDGFMHRKLLPERFVCAILRRVRDVLARHESLYDVPVGANGVTVCGDTHGQFEDLVHIFHTAGRPSPTNPFVFNGDFVDRGRQGVEVCLTLFMFKVLYPEHVHLTRGNHECKRANRNYGFLAEVMAKYSEPTYNLFAEVFQHLPLAVTLAGRVIIVHGGLASSNGVTLEDIRRLRRVREPPMSGLMSDLLWSDPRDADGRQPSPRGAGVLFGPDCTAAFLDSNGLECMIRSHEMQQEGYALQRGERCHTVFSAPNYSMQQNKGAYLTLDSNLKVTVNQFTSKQEADARA